MLAGPLKSPVAFGVLGLHMIGWTRLVFMTAFVLPSTNHVRDFGSSATTVSANSFPSTVIPRGWCSLSKAVSAREQNLILPALHP